MATIQINKSCHELQSGDQYNYSISLQDCQPLQDCDCTWTAEDGRLLHQGSSVVLDYCRSGIRHVVRCLKTSTLKEYIFNVFGTTSTVEMSDANKSFNTTETPEPSQFNVWVILAIVFLLVLFIGSPVAGVCFRRNPRLNRWIRGVWEGLVCGYRRPADENNRVDPVDVITNGGLNSDVKGEKAQPLIDKVHHGDEFRVSEGR